MVSVMIGIPAKDEELTITKIITESKKFGEVVVVDDGSIDSTYELAEAAGAAIIFHLNNIGYGASISDLFKYANTLEVDVLITIDSDGQHNPSEIPNFIQALKTSDVVIGNRFLTQSNIPSYREFGVKAISKLNKLNDSQCGFRAFNKKAIQKIVGNIFEKGMGASIEILKLIQSKDLKITEIPCTIKYNKKEKHSQNPLSHGLDLILAFVWWFLWKKPSRTLFPLGLLFLFGATISSIQMLNLYAISHYIVQTWALLTGFLLLCTFMTFNTLIFILVFKNKKVSS